ncbi:MAG TPA: hypothetical protein VK200_06575 [Candidatus Limnocylindrales bacterium]|nr:hypothetical protein [Candidatus Limnocylindrales bacterium]
MAAIAAESEARGSVALKVKWKCAAKVQRLGRRHILVLHREAAEIYYVVPPRDFGKQRPTAVIQSPKYFNP